MGCPKCGQANPPEAKFCMSCGLPQRASCPACSTELPAGAAFCFKCGAKQGVAPPAEDLDARLRRLIPPELLSKLQRVRSGGAQGERRTVTMLFCDVKGSTA